MPIKLKNVKVKQEGKIKELGACRVPDSKTWFIPDTVKDINPFAEWLPKKEGFIVQRPYFVARARMSCYKCGKETPIVALGEKYAQEFAYMTRDKGVWQDCEGPFIFTEVGFLEEEAIGSLQEYYPFFQRSFCKDLRRKLWGSNCVHCGVLQEEYGEFRYEANALKPVTVEDMAEIRIVHFKLNFDYFISACYCSHMLYDGMV
jgi:hypothetical protein